MTVQEALDVQRTRRLRGLPAVSILVDGLSESADCWSIWAARRGLPSTILDDQIEGTLARAWITAAIERMSLRETVYEFLGIDGHAFERKSPAERRMLLDHLGNASPPNSAKLANRELCRACLEGELEIESANSAIVSVARCLATAAPSGSPAGNELLAFKSLADLYGASGMPALLIRMGDEDGARAEAFGANARDLCRLVEMSPHLTAGIAASRSSLEIYLRNAPKSRAKAMVVEGIIDGTRPPQSDPPNDASHEFLCLRREMSCMVSGRTDVKEAEELGNRARSAAERFLFSVLQSAKDTKGLFLMNAQLPFRFGALPAEADLLAPELRLVIEVDGYYHFAEPAAYRRDRRKDALLQAHGYHVLRFLAEDVVDRLETILSEIQDAIAVLRLRRSGADTPAE